MMIRTLQPYELGHPLASRAFWLIMHLQRHTQHCGRHCNALLSCHLNQPPNHICSLPLLTHPSQASHFSMAPTSMLTTTHTCHQRHFRMYVPD